MNRIKIVCLSLALSLFMGCTDNVDPALMSADSFSGKESTTGQGGSLARFAIVGKYLYVVDHSSLLYYSLSDPEKPVYIGRDDMGFGIETIYSDGPYLYIGSENGMYTYSISDPSNPQFLSQYQHITSCDPVVVQDDYAYVTLRTSTNCRWLTGANRMDVINIQNRSQPYLITSIDMISPIGLGIRGNHLFVCEAENGVVYFDASNPANPKRKKSYPNISGFDVIMLPNHLIVTALDGLHQYDYSDPLNLRLLSHIKVKG